MKKSFLRLICCPVCKKEFTLEVFSEELGEVLDGILVCSCAKPFPIINGIPRILPDTLMGTVESKFPEFFAQHKNIFTARQIQEVSSESVKKEKTSKSFGFEWEKFSGMRDE